MGLLTIVFYLMSVHRKRRSVALIGSSARVRRLNGLLGSAIRECCSEASLRSTARKRHSGSPLGSATS
uniref:Uncharacterized protein n=1 Tax=Acrobeloides nanus TaxID=290746 RepID=A0A914CTU1_9BILA